MTPEEVGALTRRALRLAKFTVGYNIVEGGVAITAGLMAHLVSVVGFGVDSGIESISAILVAIRLSARLRHREVDEAKERLTLRLVAVTFFLLATYVTVEGIRSLLNHDVPETSTVAVVLLIASMIVMPVLAWLKMRVGHALGDRLILADAAETRICVLLSVSTLLGVGLYALTGAAWLDPVAGFIIALFAISEGREAWQGDLDEDCC